jgi:hypothetical protein
MWGFQASNFGAKAIEGTDYAGIPPNVLFAHLAYSTNPLNFGLGAYIWQKTPDNVALGSKGTNLYAFDTRDLHPGDGNANVQNKFIAEMKRVIKTAEAAS